MRTREQISEKQLQDLQKNIGQIVQEYQKNHPSNFFTGLFSTDIQEDVLSGLQEEIREIVDNPKPLLFVRYVQILQALNNRLDRLKEQDINIIKNIKALLSENLAMQKEADWHQSKAQFRSVDENNKITYSLRMLSQAARCNTKEEQEQQDFYDKWHEFGTLQDFPIWGHLIQNIDDRLDDMQAPTMVEEIKGLIGLKEISQVRSVDDQSYGHHAENRDKSVGSLQAIVNAAKKELLKLEAERGSINSHRITGILEKMSDPSNLNKLVLIKKLIAIGKENSLGKEVDHHLKEINKIFKGYSSNESLSPCDMSRVNDFIKKVINELSFQIKINDLLANIRKYDESNSFADLKALISVIRTEKNEFVSCLDRNRIFSTELHDTVSQFEKQINLMTLTNLLTLASDYMWHYAEQLCSATIGLCKEKQEYMSERFLLPMVKHVIDPIRALFNLERLDEVDDCEQDIVKGVQNSQNKLLIQRKLQSKKIKKIKRMQNEETDDEESSEQEEISTNHVESHQTKLETALLAPFADRVSHIIDFYKQRNALFKSENLKQSDDQACAASIQVINHDNESPRFKQKLDCTSQQTKLRFFFFSDKETQLLERNDATDLTIYALFKEDFFKWKLRRGEIMDSKAFAYPSYDLFKEEKIAYLEAKNQQEVYIYFEYQMFKNDINKWKSARAKQEKPMDYPSYATYKEERVNYLKQKKAGQLCAYFNIYFSSKELNNSMAMLRIKNTYV